MIYHKHLRSVERLSEESFVIIHVYGVILAKARINNMWCPSLYRLLTPRPLYIWYPVRILHETNKAILVYNGGKTWVPKSWIRGIRLRGATFEIHIEGTLA